jgi:hypothetical protein
LEGLKGGREGGGGRRRIVAQPPSILKRTRSFVEKDGTCEKHYAAWMMAKFSTVKEMGFLKGGSTLYF